MTQDLRKLIPCRVCGDKASGVHYGLLSCEGCKGFFRRNQSAQLTCSGGEMCDVSLSNRNKCRSCRLQKCLKLGMSRDAVKFGRMSKMQREQINDEIRLLQGRTSGASFDQTYPNSDTSSPNYTTFSFNSNSGDVGSYTPQYMPDDVSSNIADSTTGYDSSRSIEQSNAVENAENPLLLDILHRGIAEAHFCTVVHSIEDIDEMFRKPQDVTKLLHFQNMDRGEMWLEVAQELTIIIERIIQFAKMIPGFMKLSEDDKIILLKEGSFELALLRMSRYFDPPSNSVLYAGCILTQDVFASSDTAEMNLVSSIFEIAKSIKELKLTETELALFSAIVLLASDRPGLLAHAEIRRLQEAVVSTLLKVMNENHESFFNGGVTWLDFIMGKIPALRDLSMFHKNVLANFKQSNPFLEFPLLHKELFSFPS